MSEYEITVLHTDAIRKGENALFKEHIVEKRRIFGFNFIVGLKDIVNNYDIIIALFDIRWLSIMSLLFIKRDFKIILWGIGTSKNEIANRIRISISKRSDALILYMDSLKDRFIKNGLNNEKIFIARNTLAINQVPFSIDLAKKKSFLFIGSLYKEKQLETLLIAFSQIKNKLSRDIKVNIIGDGSEKERLLKLTTQLNLEDRVNFLGEILDESVLANYYKSAIASISPGQAGLSVLQSLAFGVPFITRYDAVSGGEIDNIIEGKSGYLFDGTPENLAQLMLNLYVDFSKVIELSRFSYDYYRQNCKVKFMLNGFTEAINFVIKKPITK